MSRTSYLSVIFISSALLLSSLLLLLLLGERGEFVPDIIGSLWYFWTPLTLAMILAILSRILAGRDDCTGLRVRLAGVIIVICVISALMLGPILDVFSIGRGDTLTQIGITSDLTAASTVSDDDFYPVAHIFSSSAVQLLDVDVADFFAIFPIFIWLFFLTSFLAVSRQISRFRRTPFVAMIIVSLCPLGPMHAAMLPMALALTFIPLLLYSAHRSMPMMRHAGFSICFFIFAIALPGIHPLAAMVIIIPTLAIAMNVRNRDSVILPDATSGQVEKMIPLLPLFLMISTIWWVTTYNFWETGAKGFIDWVLGEGTISSTGQRYFSLLSTSDVGFAKFMQVAFLSVGNLAMILASFVFAYVMCRPAQRQHRNAICTSLYYGIGIAAGIQILVFAAPTGLDIMRMIWIGGLFIAFIAVPGINSALLGNCGNTRLLSGTRRVSERSRRSATIILVLLLLLSAALVPFSIYKSPATYQPSEIVTDGEIEFAATVSVVLNGSSMPIIGFGASYRLFYASLGCELAESMYNVQTRREIPDHFGYDKFTTANSSFAADSAIILTRYDKEAYLGVWDSANVFTREDFDRFEFYDQSVSCTIDCGAARLFLVRI